jgi:SAM-dependent methyltransferase
MTGEGPSRGLAQADFDAEAVRRFEREGWNRAAATYERAFATATRQFIGPLLDAAAIGAGDRVLDLCCGPGFVGAGAMARGAAVNGLDFSTGMLAEARDRFPAITFDHGDAEAPPYRDECFDAVVSNFGIHHVPRPDVALGQSHRVLRQGGRIAFSVWAGDDENIAWKLVFDAVRRHGDPHASAAPPPGGGFRGQEDCARALGNAGFSRVEAHIVRATWRHTGAAALLAALRAGTARMAAILDAQTDAAMPEIVAGLDAAAAPWRVRGPDGDEIAVPIACVIAAGIKG